MRKILSDRQWIVWLYLGCLAAASIFGAGYAVGKADGCRYGCATCGVQKGGVQ